MFRFQYSPEFLKWALQPPGHHVDWHLGGAVQVEPGGVQVAPGLTAFAFTACNYNMMNRLLLNRLLSISTACYEPLACNMKRLM